MSALETYPANDPTPEELRAPLLKAALPHSAFDGWTWKAFRRAAQDLELPAAMAEIAFADLDDAVDFYLAETDRAMSAAMAAPEMQALKIREKVTRAVLVRFERAEAQKEAARRAAGYLAQRPGLSARTLWRTADAVWCAIGDKSTDYNWYTKRMILSGVYSSTLLVWLTDEDPEMARTKAFLDRRIGNVMQFEKAKGQVLKAQTRLPNLTRFLGRLRYPEPR